MPDDLDPKRRIRIPRERHIDGCGCKRCRTKRNASMPDPSLATESETQRLVTAAGVTIEPVDKWKLLPTPPIECIQFGRMVRYRRTDVARLIKALRASGD